MSDGKGDGMGTGVGTKSGTLATSFNMSSGSAKTTGPGRPDSAVFQARARYSGMRAGSLISATHLAISPKTRRKSIS